MQGVTTIGLDIAKSVFQVHGIDAEGKVLIRRKLGTKWSNCVCLVNSAAVPTRTCRSNPALKAPSASFTKLDRDQRARDLGSYRVHILSKQRHGSAADDSRRSLG